LKRELNLNINTNPAITLRIVSVSLLSGGGVKIK